MRKLGAVLLAAAAGLMLVACGSGDDGGSPGGAARHKGRWKIVLSNNYMGNEWRPQMVNQLNFVAHSAKYADKVDFDVQNVELTPTAQIASLQSITRQKPDAILLNAASPTALNPTVEQACKAGILVITFDQTATAPCAYVYQVDYERTGHDMVEFLATALRGRGDILMDTGLAGVPISETWLRVWRQILAEKYPDIHVVGTYSAQYAPGPELQGVSSLLSQHDHIDGVLSGAYCSSIVKALRAANRPLVPMTCLNVNGNEQVCEQNRLPCLFVGAPSWVGAVALEAAVKILEGGEQPRLTQTYDKNFVNNPDNFEFDHELEAEPLTPGVNYYPDESPSLITPITYDDWNMTPADVLGQ